MKIDLLPATQEQKAVIQNLARFYAYDLSKSCGFYDLFDWSFPETGLYEGRDLSAYWKANCYPFIIRIDGELAGFAIVDKTGTTKDVDWNMVEFFIVGKFQGKGFGSKIAIQLFNQFPGTWEVMQMPDNIPAIKFWKKVVGEYTNNNFSEDRKIFSEPEPHENIILKFKTH
jgi:predicted acetyltransferase